MIINMIDIIDMIMIMFITINIISIIIIHSCHILPFSQFCEIDISLLSLQNHPKQPKIYISEGGRIWQVFYFHKNGSTPFYTIVFDGSTPFIRYNGSTPFYTLV